MHPLFKNCCISGRFVNYHDGVNSDAFFPADEPQFFRGSCLDIHLANTAFEQACQALAHGRNGLSQSWCLCHQRDIEITQLIACCCNQLINSAQQFAAVSIGIRGVCVGEMLSNITRSDGSQQGVTHCVQRYITV